MGVAVGKRSPRLSHFVLYCLAAVLVVGALSVATEQPRALAQDEEKKPDEARKERPDFFTHVVTSAGPVFGIIMLLVSIALVTLIVLMTMDLRMGVAVPPGLVDEFTDTVNKRQFKQAFELVRS